MFGAESSLFQKPMREVCFLYGVVKTRYLSRERQELTIKRAFVFNSKHSVGKDKSYQHKVLLFSTLNIQSGKTRAMSPGNTKTRLAIHSFGWSTMVMVIIIHQWALWYMSKCMYECNQLPVKKVALNTDARLSGICFWSTVE